MRSLLVLALAAAVLAPLDAEAQRRRVFGDDDDCCSGNRFSLEPYGGATKDAYDIGAEDDQGDLLGFRVAYTLGSRTRLVGNLGYSNTENVSDHRPLTNYYIYDNVCQLTTAGAESDAV